MKIDSIHINGRHRRDLGDVSSLAQSIRRVGLLHPVVVTPEGRLVAGARRLEACRLLGWKEVPVRVVSLEDLLFAERDENVCRKDFTPSEAVAIGLKLEALEREKARWRQREHGGTAPGKRRNTPDKLSEVNGETRHRVAVAVGMSATSFRKAAEVVRAAWEDPRRFAPLQEVMDRTGKVDKAWRQLQVERIREAAQAESGGLEVLSSLEEGVGRFRCILLDPPWEYRDEGCRGAAAGHYPTLSFEELAAVPVSQLAHPEGAHFWMWTTSPLILECTPQRLLERWGLRGVSMLHWNKLRMGAGRYLRSQVEVLILAVPVDRPTLPLLEAGVGNLLDAPRGQHSQKPEESYKLVEGLSPGPRVELFARRARPGWARWGFEAGVTVGATPSAKCHARGWDGWHMMMLPAFHH